jgi:hypothetical protein
MTDWESVLDHDISRLEGRVSSSRTALTLTAATGISGFWSGLAIIQKYELSISDVGDLLPYFVSLVLLYSFIGSLTVAYDYVVLPELRESIKSRSRPYPVMPHQLISAALYLTATLASLGVVYLSLADGVDVLRITCFLLFALLFFLAVTLSLSPRRYRKVMRSFIPRKSRSKDPETQAIEDAKGWSAFFIASAFVSLIFGVLAGYLGGSDTWYALLPTAFLLVMGFLLLELALETYGTFIRTRAQRDRFIALRGSVLTNTEISDEETRSIYDSIQ